MRYKWITDIGEFRGLAKEWDNALAACGEDNPFLLSDFILTWWKYYSRGLGLRVLVLSREGGISAGLPLYQSKNGYLRYMGGASANYTEFLSLEADTDFWQVLPGALRCLEGWRCLYLERFRKSRLDITKLKLISSGHKDLLFNIDRRDFVYLISIPDDPEDYLSRLSGNLRYFIRRSEKRFSGLGRLSLHTLKNKTEIDGLCDKFIEFSRNSFRGRKRRSMFENKNYCAFFRELTNKLFDAGYLDANVLKLDDRVIAIHFGYSIGNKLNYVFGAFDMEFARLKPGYLLIYKLVGLGSMRKNKSLDLYSGRRRYKEELSDCKDEVYSIEIRPNCISNRVGMKISGQFKKSLIVDMARQGLEDYPGLMDRLRAIKAFTKRYV